MKTLITGANGMVAKAAANYCRRVGDDVFALTRQELDISDKQAVFLQHFEREKFDAIFELRGLHGCLTARKTNDEKILLQSKMRKA